MSGATPKVTPGGVRAFIQGMSPEERARLVRALAEALVDQLRERRRVESSRVIK